MQKPAPVNPASVPAITKTADATSMAAKAQGQELRRGVLGSLLRNLSTVTGPRLLLLPREQRLPADEPSELN